MRIGTMDYEIIQLHPICVTGDSNGRGLPSWRWSGFSAQAPSWWTLLRIRRWLLRAARDLLVRVGILLLLLLKPQIIHGAGIFTNIYPINDPVL